MPDLNNPSSSSTLRPKNLSPSNGHSSNGAAKPQTVTVTPPVSDTGTLPATIVQPNLGRRSLRMQYRFGRALIFAAWIFARILLWRFVMRRLIGQERVERGATGRWVVYAREFRGFAISMG
ncbi:MAG: hypothetical protein K8I60_10510, partial [Anaerolineae bacterium]|nr:hypothetical protein [Anaerolineae bacterium]